jgi:hypothetical protein
MGGILGAVHVIDTVVSVNRVADTVAGPSWGAAIGITVSNDAVGPHVSPLSLLAHTAASHETFGVSPSTNRQRKGALIVYSLEEEPSGVTINL